ncbi:DUF3278 domain-containing protein [Apilactobacillus sp. TMW 2.2459]|uniref:DUF3278 domain-containing protein n=1 Tax=Apilactobacillus xinyiensis TaxID=2841032 RepID=UPI00200FB7A0|nr:DUF3278 domain-containing protein [Apilactobacillus xinyiensis]MCL0312152.1 DUF3278 domain-containing protein [Apilactobacillus xinyiensis]
MKKLKESFYTKLVRRIYGVRGEFDEYKEQQIDKIGSRAFLILFIYFWISTISLSILIMSSLSKDIILFIYFMCNGIMFFILICYLSMKVSKLKLNIAEAYDHDDYNGLLRKAKKKAIFASILFFMSERILFLLMNYFDEYNNLSLWQLIISPFDNILWLTGAIFVGVTSYFTLKHKTKK